MAKTYLLKPTWDKQHSAWRLNFPPQISPSGKRERHLFKRHSEALAERDKILEVRRDFGRSIKMLPANRLMEAIESFEKLDEAFGGEAPSGSLRRIILRECRTIKDREKSITLGALFDSYVDKLRRTNRAERYIKQYGLLRNYMDFFLETKVTDLTPGNIKFSFALGKLPSGNFNSNLRLLRVALNYGIKNSWLKKNFANSVGSIHRPKLEVKCLSHIVVEKMFRHAQENNLELIPPYTIGFFTGLREAELWRLQYSNIVISETEKYVLVPAAISKTKKKRIIPLSENAVQWMQWYFQATNRQPNGDELLMSKWSRHRLDDVRQANYEAAVGPGAKWQQNAKRRAFASHFVAANQNYNTTALAMGHKSTELTFDHYVGAVSHEAGLAYWQIKP